MSMVKKRLLFYYPSNKRSIAMETLILSLKEKGCKIYLLTLSKKGDLHKVLEKENIKTCTYEISSKFKPYYFLRHILFLISFCYKYKIKTVHSHLQDANIIAVVAQFFTLSRFIIFRHHFEFYNYIKDIKITRNQNEELGKRIINKLSRKIVVPSTGVYNGMKKYEKINMSKVQVLPYVYDFESYAKPDYYHVQQIKEQYDCKIRLIMCARLIPAKRHIIVFQAIHRLINKGFDVKLLVLDEGPEELILKKFISDNHLGGHIHMLGFRRDFIDYMAAADLLLHPSLIEASNSVVKEMGLLENTVAVCDGIGDFSDYIRDGKNGFILSVDNTESDLEHVVTYSYNNLEKLVAMGKILKKDVLERFSSNEEVLEKYMSLT